MSIRRKILIAVVAVLGCMVIAVPIALFFGAGELLFGGSGSDAVLTVVFMVVGLGLLWALQFAWSTWRARRAERGGQQGQR